MKVNKQSEHESLMKVYGIVRGICISLLVMPSFFAFCGCKTILDQQKMIKIARKEALELGCDVKDKDVLISHNVLPWLILLPKNTPDGNLDKKNIFSNMEYWAVYYFDFLGEDRTLSDGVCVFIDPRNGEVITTYVGNKKR